VFYETFQKITKLSNLDLQKILKYSLQKSIKLTNASLVCTPKISYRLHNKWRIIPGLQDMNTLHPKYLLFIAKYYLLATCETFSLPYFFGSTVKHYKQSSKR